MSCFQHLEENKGKHTNQVESVDISVNDEIQSEDKIINSGNEKKYQDFQKLLQSELEDLKDPKEKVIFHPFFLFC